MNQWQVGNVKITRVIEMEIAGGTKFILPQATRDKVKEINWHPQLDQSAIAVSGRPE